MPADHNLRPISAGDRDLARRYARAVGCADATIATGLTFCKYPGRDFPAFVAQMQKLLTEAQAEIESFVNGNSASLRRGF